MEKTIAQEYTILGGRYILLYDICETNGVFNGNRKLSGIVKYTGNNVPWYMLNRNNSNFVNNNFQNLIFFCDKLYQNKRNYKMSLMSLGEKNF